jgi:hypothetical protein
MFILPDERGQSGFQQAKGIDAPGLIFRDAQPLVS